MTYPGWDRRHRVSTIRPGKLDLFVVTLVNGKRATIHPVNDYDLALARADDFVGLHPCQIKVLPMTGEEVRNFLGINLPDHPQPMDAEQRQQFAATLTKIARDSDDPDARRDALDLLTEMGVLQS